MNFRERLELKKEELEHLKIIRIAMNFREKSSGKESWDKTIGELEDSLKRIKDYWGIDNTSPIDYTKGNQRSEK